MDKVDQYHRDSKIMLDQTFENFHEKGTDIAEQLHAMGFTRLYLLSGDEFSLVKCPPYLIRILKTDLAALEMALSD